MKKKNKVRKTALAVIASAFLMGTVSSSAYAAKGDQVDKLLNENHKLKEELKEKEASKE